MGFNQLFKKLSESYYMNDSQYARKGSSAPTYTGNNYVSQKPAPVDGFKGDSMGGPSQILIKDMFGKRRKDPRKIRRKRA